MTPQVTNIYLKTFKDKSSNAAVIATKVMLKLFLNNTILLL
jgi:hypothetical protein